MKNNQPEPDADGVERTKLAAIGVLVGGVIAGGFLLLLMMGAKPDLQTPASTVKPETDAGVVLPAANAQQPGSVLGDEESKDRVNRYQTAKRKMGPLSLPKAQKPNKPYTVSVAPGKTPRMTEVR